MNIKRTIQRIHSIAKAAEAADSILDHVVQLTLYCTFPQLILQCFRHL